MKKFYTLTFLALSYIFLSKCSGYVDPYVVSFSPANGATGVSISTTISFTFNKKINANRVNTNTSDSTCSGTVQVSADSFSTCVRMSQAPVASNDNKTYTITPNSNLAGSTVYTIRLTSGIQDEDGAKITTTSSSFTTTNLCGVTGQSCFIFLSDTSTNGDIDGRPGGNDNNTGIEEADTICNNDANKPNASNYKAMVTHFDQRNKDDNWVLQASTQYTRPDGTVIGTTNGSSLFVFASFNSISDENERVWTGLLGSWGKSTNKCSESNGSYAWMSSSDSTVYNFMGSYGTSNSSTSTAIYAGEQACNLTAKLYCVEQP